ncbi:MULTISPECIES: sensor histidine kinase [Methylocaldum]|uniref:sensor histidine kinase n=1 Tax=unclassified Methylocaldum TaxID=2622260 RepID=UPI001B52EFCE|nr:HAMP domain-containing sensor histidine kinase [Methylocaldum sp. 14B]
MIDLKRMRFEKLFSLKYLIPIGFVVVLVPLLFAVMYAAFAMRDIARLEQRTFYQIVEQVKTARSALQMVSDIERKAKLFVILAHPALRQPYERQSYETVRNSLREALGELLKMGVDEKVALSINQLSEQERLVYEQIISSDTGDRVALPDDQAFQGLHAAANALWQEISEQVDREAKQLYAQSRSVQQDLVIKAGFLLPTSVAVILFLLTLLSRSVRQLDEAIRRLTARDFGKPISVAGPQDLRYLGDQLELLRTRLRSLEESKRQLMDNVSIEIETPLARIVESAEQLEMMSDEAGPEQREIGRTLTTNIQKLQELLAELTRYNRLHEEPEQNVAESVKMQDLLRSVIADHRPRLQAKSLTVKELVQPVEVSGDRDQLQTIIDNLISNAVSYSPVGGEIRIILRAVGGNMELEVEDDGPGIDEEESKHVFEPFYRGKAASSLATEGTGMGLAIASECVANQRGKIEVLEPRQDKQGARIRVQLPLVEAA